MPCRDGSESFVACFNDPNFRYNPACENSLLPTKQEDTSPGFDNQTFQYPTAYENSLLPIKQEDTSPGFDNQTFQYHTAYANSLLPIKQEDTSPGFDNQTFQYHTVYANSLLPIKQEDTSPGFDNQTFQYHTAYENSLLPIQQEIFSSPSNQTALYNPRIPATLSSGFKDQTFQYNTADTISQLIPGSSADNPVPGNSAANRNDAVVSAITFGNIKEEKSQLSNPPLLFDDSFASDGREGVLPELFKQIHALRKDGNSFEKIAEAINGTQVNFDAQFNFNASTLRSFYRDPLNKIQDDRRKYIIGLKLLGESWEKIAAEYRHKYRQFRGSPFVLWRCYTCTKTDTSWSKEETTFIAELQARQRQNNKTPEGIYEEFSRKFPLRFNISYSMGRAKRGGTSATFMVQPDLPEGVAHIVTKDC
jgi:hypothetical protein